MTTAKANLALNIIASIGLAVGGASTIPGFNLPSQVLFWGLLIAGIAKAVSSQLVQVKGESDEAQGISPGQVAASQAVHLAATVAPAPTTTPSKP